MKNRSVAAMFIALVCMMLVLGASTAMASSSEGDLIRFIPTVITVKTESVKVEGYFVNLNTDCDVKNFKEFEMTVYQDGDELISAEFGDINQFTIEPLGTKYQSFTFNMHHNLNNGVYSCDDHFYTSFSCRFTTAR